MSEYEGFTKNQIEQAIESRRKNCGCSECREDREFDDALKRADEERASRTVPSRDEEIHELETRIEYLNAENAQLLRQIHILDLSVPLEEDLQDRAYDLLARMHLPQGWSVVEVAQLIIDMQKRIAADWVEIGNLIHKNNKPL